MQKRKIISIVLLIITILSINTSMVSASAVTTTENSTKQGPANSWRYSDGKVSNLISIQNLLFSTTATKPKNTTMVGIDVSEHNGNINWSKVSKKIDYAILRVGYGDNYTSQDDKKFKTNADACKKYKIPFGVYIYSYAKNTSQAKSEANHVLRVIRGYKLNFPVYYDLEDNSQTRLGSSKLGAIAKTFCNTILNEGYNVGIYANLNWWNNYLINSAFKNSKWYKWVAQVNTSKCTYKGTYQMWQHSFEGKVDGISGNTDMNYWFGPKIKSTYAYATTKTCLSINKSSINFKLGNNQSKTSKITAKTSDNSKVNYSSSNTKVATVNSDGKVTAKGRGSCTIKVSLRNEPKTHQNCKVNVKQLVTKINFNKNNVTISDQTKTPILKLNVYPNNANNKTIKWSNSNKNVATVNSKGKITVKNKGTCIVSCSTVDGSKLNKSCKITVSKIVPTAIKADNNYYVDLGKKVKLKYTILPSNATNKNATYVSSDTNIATVDKNGYVTGKKEGKCSITINSSQKGISTNVNIYVKRLVTNVSVTTNKVSIYQNTQYQINTLVLPSNATTKTLTYHSSNENVATVDNKGLITGLNVGACTITISSTDGSNKKCTIEVTVKDTTAQQKTINFAKSLKGKGLKTLMKIDKTNTFVADQWCAMFCQYVLRSTNPNSIATQVSSKSCGSWSLGLNSKKKYHAHGTKYIPKAGDLIFFTYSNAKGAQPFLNHIGLITEYNPKTYMIKTIEGNTNGNGIYTTTIAEKEYFINNDKINGFGEVDYN